MLGHFHSAHEYVNMLKVFPYKIYIADFVRTNDKYADKRFYKPLTFSNRNLS